MHYKRDKTTMYTIKCGRSRSYSLIGVGDKHSAAQCGYVYVSNHSLVCVASGHYLPPPIHAHSLLLHPHQIDFFHKMPIALPLFPVTYPPHRCEIISSDCIIISRRPPHRHLPQLYSHFHHQWLGNSLFLLDCRPLVLRGRKNKTHKHKHEYSKRTS